MGCPGFPSGSVVKNPPTSVGDVGWIPGFGRSHGEVKGNPLQHSCLGNLTDREAQRVKVHGVAKAGDNLATKQQQRGMSSWRLPKGTCKYGI